MEYEESLNRVCSYFGVALGDLRKKDKTSNVAYARNFVYYVLHIDLRLSINQISKILDREQRNIKRMIANVRYNIEHNKEYRKTYRELTTYIYDI